jgi:hypothetical protein
MSPSERELLRVRRGLGVTLSTNASSLRPRLPHPSPLVIVRAQPDLSAEARW